MSSNRAALGNFGAPFVPPPDDFASSQTYASLPFGIIGLLVLWRAFPDVRRSRKRLPIDISGAVTVMSASALLLLALSWGGRQFAWGSPQARGTSSACPCW